MGALGYLRPTSSQEEPTSSKEELTTTTTISAVDCHQLTRSIVPMSQLPRRSRPDMYLICSAVNGFGPSHTRAPARASALLPRCLYCAVRVATPNSARAGKGAARRNCHSHSLSRALLAENLSQLPVRDDKSFSARYHPPGDSPGATGLLSCEAFSTACHPLDSQTTKRTGKLYQSEEAARRRGMAQKTHLRTSEKNPGRLWTLMRKMREEGIRVATDRAVDRAIDLARATVSGAATATATATATGGRSAIATVTGGARIAIVTRKGVSGAAIETGGIASAVQSVKTGIGRKIASAT
eukprot:4429513-Pleurochrysis_carterae.AAC.2